MINTVTGVLLLVALGTAVYAAGIERSRDAAASAAGAGRRAASSGVAAGAAGLGLGLQFGNDLVMAVMAEPFAVTTALAGVMGALGIEGVLGISGLQFLAIGFSVFALVYVVTGD
jgi:hypothetical protein